MLMSLADQEISQAIICQQTALFSANNLYKLPVTLDYIAWLIGQQTNYPKLIWDINLHLVLCLQVGG